MFNPHSRCVIYIFYKNTKFFVSINMFKLIVWLLWYHHSRPVFSGDQTALFWSPVSSRMLPCSVAWSPGAAWSVAMTTSAVDDAPSPLELSCRRSATCGRNWMMLSWDYNNNLSNQKINYNWKDSEFFITIHDHIHCRQHNVSSRMLLNAICQLEI